MTHMEKVGVRELRQNLSRYLTRIKAGESLAVTERGTEVAVLTPSGPHAEGYARLAARFGAEVPAARMRDIADGLSPPGAPAGATDEFLAEGRSGRR
jgi:prevent-host-death family protein